MLSPIFTRMSAVPEQGMGKEVQGRYSVFEGFAVTGMA